MTTKIDYEKYETQQAILKARLGMLKTFAYLANKNDIVEIEKLIQETEQLLKKAEQFNDISYNEKLSETDLVKLKDIYH